MQTMSGLRFICFRVGFHTGQVLITIVCGKNIKDHLNKLSAKWMAQWKEVVGITLNIQPINNNKIFGNETLTIRGIDYIEEYISGVKLQLTSTTFFQVNTPLAEHIINNIAKWFMKSVRPLKVIDAYCGVGTISLPLCTKGFSVIGIDSLHESIIQAKRNALINSISNAKFIHADVDQTLRDQLSSEDGLILDPPRKGLSQNLIKIILMKLPCKISYLSCNPATLARDLKLITKTGKYELITLQPIDFFPQTTHVECLANLIRINF